MKKSEIRTHKVKQFICVPKELAREKGKFEKEIGIYNRILALPEKKDNGEPFDFSVEGYCEWYGCGTDAIYAGLKNLISRGWVERIVVTNEKGQFEKTIYDLLPEKKIKPQEGNPHRENPDVENPHREKPEQKNTRIKEDIGISLKPYSSQHTHKGVVEEEKKMAYNDELFTAFQKSWNYMRTQVPNCTTATFSRMTKKRKELLTDLFDNFRDEAGNVDMPTMRRGMRRAMESAVAQGKAKKSQSPADIEYLLRLDNFIKLVEGSM